MSLVVIDPEKCTRDRKCVRACPSRLLTMDTPQSAPTATQEFAAYCLKCGHCVAVCPTGALSLDWLRPEGCTPMLPELRLTPEQAEQFLTGRRSIRAFKRATVDRAVIEKILRVASSAPSAKNMQPWHWIVVQSPEDVRRYAGMVIDWMRSILKAAPEKAAERGFDRVVAAWDRGEERICRGAPHLIVAHADRNWMFGPEDCSLAIGIADLYATSLGLGCCWAGYLYSAINAHPPLSAALGLPENHKAFGAIMLGHPRFEYRRIPLRNPPKVSWM